MYCAMMYCVLRDVYTLYCPLLFCPVSLSESVWVDIGVFLLCIRVYSTNYNTTLIIIIITIIHTIQHILHYTDTKYNIYLYYIMLYEEAVLYTNSCIYITLCYTICVCVYVCVLYTTVLCVCVL